MFNDFDQFENLLKDQDDVETEHSDCFSEKTSTFTIRFTAIATVMALIVIIPAIYIGLIYQTRSIVNHALGSITKNTAIHIEINGVFLGYGNFEINEITVASKVSAKIEGFSATFGLSPFQSDFLKLTSIDIDNVSLKTRLPVDLETLISNFMDTKNNENPTTLKEQSVDHTHTARTTLPKKNGVHFGKLIPIILEKLLKASSWISSLDSLHSTGKIGNRNFDLNSPLSTSSALKLIKHFRSFISHYATKNTSITVSRLQISVSSPPSAFRTKSSDSLPIPMSKNTSTTKKIKRLRITMIAENIESAGNAVNSGKPSIDSNRLFTSLHITKMKINHTEQIKHHPIWVRMKLKNSTLNLSIGQKQLHGEHSHLPWSFSSILRPSGTSALQVSLKSTSLPPFITNGLEVLLDSSREKKATRSMNNKKKLHTFDFMKEGSISIKARVASTALGIGFSGGVSIRKVSVQHDFISPSKLGPMDFKLTASGSYHPKNQTLTLRHASATIMNVLSQRQPQPGLRVEMNGEGDFSRPDIPFGVWGGQLKIPPISCTLAAESLPHGLLKEVDRFKLAGSLSLSTNFRFDSQHPERFFFSKTRTNFQCMVIESPTEFSRSHLTSPFRFKTHSAVATSRMFNLTPGTTHFTSLTKINRTLIKAVIASEDTGFWHHNGFEIAALKAAVRNNLQSPRIKIGGSTITMQTVKNLFLNRKKTLDRKMRELFLAWHLENTISKERILEIYLNIIEFGPNIYGVTDASRHFFAKNPADLSLHEATFLVSLLPSPVSRYRSICRGVLPAAFSAVVQRKIGRMQSQGVISMQESIVARGEVSHLNFSDDFKRRSFYCRKNFARN